MMGHPCFKTEADLRKLFPRSLGRLEILFFFKSMAPNGDCGLNGAADVVYRVYISL